MRALLRTLFRRLILQSVDRLAMALTRRANSDGGVLLVRLDAIGDFVLWLDAARHFRQLYPGQRITLLANSHWSALAETLPYWDEVRPVDVRRLARAPLYRFKLLCTVRKAGYGVAIQPTFSRIFWHGDAMVRATGAPHRIGSVGDTSNISEHQKSRSDHWYTRLVPAAPGSTMELLRNAEFLSNFSGQQVTAGLPALPPGPMTHPQLLPEAAFLVVFPGASWNGRQWPAEKFAQVAEVLSQQQGWQVVVCGGPTDQQACQAVVRLCGAPVVNLCGQSSLTDLVELIRQARLLISNETSAIHIAAAVQTPAVGVLGGGHHGRFMPYPTAMPGLKPEVVDHRMPCYQCNWNCTQAHAPGTAVPCIGLIDVPAVLRAADKALAQPRRSDALVYPLSFQARAAH